MTNEIIMDTSLPFRQELQILNQWDCGMLSFYFFAILCFVSLFNGTYLHKKIIIQFHLSRCLANAINRLEEGEAQCALLDSSNLCVSDYQVLVSSISQKMQDICFIVVVIDLSAGWMFFWRFRYLSFWCQNSL